jgi:hypothetical protein
VFYIHPALPHPAVIEAYYKDCAQSHLGILRAAWGFTVETATQGLAGLRLACANARTETAA